MSREYLGIAILRVYKQMSHDKRIPMMIYLLHLTLLRLVVVEQLASVLQQHGALGLRRGSLNTAAKDNDLGVLSLLHLALRITQDHHTLHDAALAQRASAQLGNAHTVQVELGELGRGRHGGLAGTDHQLTQKVLISVLLGRQNGLDRQLQVNGVSNILNSFYD